MNDAWRGMASCQEAPSNQMRVPSIARGQRLPVAKANLCVPYLGERLVVLQANESMGRELKAGILGDSIT